MPISKDDIHKIIRTACCIAVAVSFGLMAYSSFKLVEMQRNAGLYTAINSRTNDNILKLFHTKLTLAGFSQKEIMDVIYTETHLTDILSDKAQQESQK